MRTICVAPELAFTVTNAQGNEVNIYHAYSGEHALAYWYTADEGGEEEYEFDIRAIEPTVSGSGRAVPRHRRALTAALLDGRIKFDGPDLIRCDNTECEHAQALDGHSVRQSQYEDDESQMTECLEGGAQ